MGDQYRQGDILIERIRGDKLPKKGLVPMPRKDDKLILAEGEATGHNHVLSGGDTVLLVPDNDMEEVDGRYITTSEAVELSHDEHATITLPANSTFKVTRQREYQEPTPTAPARQRPVYD